MVWCDKLSIDIFYNFIDINRTTLPCNILKTCFTFIHFSRQKMLIVLKVAKAVWFDKLCMQFFVWFVIFLLIVLKILLKLVFFSSNFSRREMLIVLEVAESGLV